MLPCCLEVKRAVDNSLGLDVKVGNGFARWWFRLIIGWGLVEWIV
jgi:hypothetical protein